MKEMNKLNKIETEGKNGRREQKKRTEETTFWNEIN
jgi:hypothetical protein